MREPLLGAVQKGGLRCDFAWEFGEFRIVQHELEKRGALLKIFDFVLTLRCSGL